MASTNSNQHWVLVPSKSEIRKKKKDDGLLLQGFYSNIVADDDDSSRRRGISVQDEDDALREEKLCDDDEKFYKRGGNVKGLLKCLDHDSIIAPKTSARLPKKKAFTPKEAAQYLHYRDMERKLGKAYYPSGFWKSIGLCRPTKKVIEKVCAETNHSAYEFDLAIINPSTRQSIIALLLRAGVEPNPGPNVFTNFTSGVVRTSIFSDNTVNSIVFIDRPAFASSWTFPLYSPGTEPHLLADNNFIDSYIVSLRELCSRAGVPDNISAEHLTALRSLLLQHGVESNPGPKGYSSKRVDDSKYKKCSPADREVKRHAAVVSTSGYADVITNETVGTFCSSTVAADLCPKLKGGFTSSQCVLFDIRSGRDRATCTMCKECGEQATVCPYCSKFFHKSLNHSCVSSTVPSRVLDALFPQLPAAVSKPLKAPAPVEFNEGSCPTVLPSSPPSLSSSSAASVSFLSSSDLQRNKEALKALRSLGVSSDCSSGEISVSLPSSSTSSLCTTVPAVRASDLSAPNSSPSSSAVSRVVSDFSVSTSPSLSTVIPPVGARSVPDRFFHDIIVSQSDSEGLGQVSTQFGRLNKLDKLPPHVYSSDKMCGFEHGIVPDPADKKEARLPTLRGQLVPDYAISDILSSSSGVDLSLCNMRLTRCDLNFLDDVRLTTNKPVEIDSSPFEVLQYSLIPSVHIFLTLKMLVFQLFAMVFGSYWFRNSSNPYFCGVWNFCYHIFVSSVQSVVFPTQHFVAPEFSFVDGIFAVVLHWVCVVGFFYSCYRFLWLVRWYYYSSELFITYVPHMLSCVVTQFDRGTNAVSVRSSIRAKFLRLSCLNADSQNALGYIESTEAVAMWYIEHSDFSMGGSQFLRTLPSTLTSRGARFMPKEHVLVNSASRTPLIMSSTIMSKDLKCEFRTIVERDVKRFDDYHGVLSMDSPLFVWIQMTLILLFEVTRSGFYGLVQTCQYKLVGRSGDSSGSGAVEISTLAPHCHFKNGQIPPPTLLSRSSILEKSTSPSMVSPLLDESRPLLLDSSNQNSTLSINIRD